MSRKYIYVKKRYQILFRAVDAIGFFLKRIFFKNHSETQPPIFQKILVVELAHLGDVLVTTPALRALRKKFPKAQITMAVAPWSRDALEGNPDLDRVVTYRPSWFDRTERRPFSVQETWAFIQWLQKEHFDLGIDMRCDFRVMVMLWLAKVRYRIGYGFTGGGFLLTHEVPFSVEKRALHHQIEHNLRLVDEMPWGEHLPPVTEKSRAMTFQVSELLQTQACEYLKKLGVSESDWLVVVHPGSGLPEKRWPIEGFQKLIEKMVQTFPVFVLLVGSAEETCLADRILSLRLPRVESLIGKTSVPQAAALIQKARLFIGSDSGLMHLASAVQTPVAAIWGNHVNPSLWRPLGVQDRVICKKSPAHISGCGSIYDVTVEEVWREVRIFLETGVSL